MYFLAVDGAAPGARHYRLLMWTKMCGLNVGQSVEKPHFCQDRVLLTALIVLGCSSDRFGTVTLRLQNFRRSLELPWQIQTVGAIDTGRSCEMSPSS